MSDSRWFVELQCNGKKLIDDDIDKLHTLGEGIVQCWQFEVDGLLELKITREKTE